MACDICGKTGCDLVDLLELYQTDDIKQVCDKCRFIVDRRNGKLMTLVLGIKRDLLKRFMRERKRRQEPTGSGS